MVIGTRMKNRGDALGSSQSTKRKLKKKCAMRSMAGKMTSKIDAEA
jgi:hypothetical protein